MEEFLVIKVYVYFQNNRLSYYFFQIIPFKIVFMLLNKSKFEHNNYVQVQQMHQTHSNNQIQQNEHKPQQANLISPKQKEPPSQLVVTVILKNRLFYPDNIELSQKQNLKVIVGKDNHLSLSQISSLSSKKYIFSLDEIYEQSDPLIQGGQFNIQGIMFKGQVQGQPYTLTCVNIPRIKCLITVRNEPQVKSNEKQKNIQIEQQSSKLTQKQNNEFINSCINGGSFNLTSVKQQQTQEQLKHHKSDTVSVYERSSKSDISDYQKILASNTPIEDTMQNRYLNHFKDQFKLWKNFFKLQQEQQEKEQKPISQSSVQCTVKTLPKQKLSLSDVKFKKNISQKKKDITQALEYSDFSNFEKTNSIEHDMQSYPENTNLQDREKDLLQSLKKQTKKTNSEYGFKIMKQSSDQNETLLKKIDLKSDKNIRNSLSIKRTQNSSPTFNQSYKDNNFLNWAIQWSRQKQYQEIKVSKKKDQHVIDQLQSFMKNKFTVESFLYL